MTLDLKHWIRSGYWASIAYYVVSDLIARARFLTGNIATTSGTPHNQFSTAKSMQYVEEVFEDYRRYARVAHFHGRVAEVGPGDNCGVAMLMLHDGAKWVDLVDRFYSKRNEHSQAEIYRALLQKYPDLIALVGDADLGNEETFGMLRRHYGENASAENFFRSGSGYDFIVSRAVFEHLFDPVLALKCMVSALTHGGYLLHKVDLRDHGMFSGTFHELKFLEIPQWIYRLMTIGSGRPNRVLIHDYRAAFQALGLVGQLLVTRLAGVGEVTPHLPYEEIAPDLRARSLAFVRSVRSRFADCFTGVSDEDLSVAGMFLIARKGVAVARQSC